jgi:hypothetical protein
MLTLHDLGVPYPGQFDSPLLAAPGSRANPHRLTAADLARQVLARALRAASAVLARHARQVARPVHAKQRRAAAALADPLVEFHADAGAPEGALYVDGKLVGYVPTQRL